MKNIKYKCIKEYPGSFTLGTIISKGQSGHWYSDIVYKHNNSFDPSKHPEYWEEIKEYPIGTRMINKETKLNYIRKEDGWYMREEKSRWTDEKMAKSSNMQIYHDCKEYKVLASGHSGDCTKSTILTVQRLADGEIFSVGDIVTYKFTKDAWVIDNFSIYEAEGLLMVAEGDALSDDWCSLNTKDFRKINTI